MEVRKTLKKVVMNLKKKIVKTVSYMNTYVPQITFHQIHE